MLYETTFAENVGAGGDDRGGDFLAAEVARFDDVVAKVFDCLADFLFNLGFVEFLVLGRGFAGGGFFLHDLLGAEAHELLDSRLDGLLVFEVFFFEDETRVVADLAETDEEFEDVGVFVL
jgi:hypothetical protein